MVSTRSDRGVRTEYWPGRDATVVWAARTVHCSPAERGHLTVSLATHGPELERDSTGAWRVRQPECPACGHRVELPAVVVAGRIDDAEFDAYASTVLAMADRIAERERAEVDYELWTVVGRALPPVGLPPIADTGPYEAGVMPDGRIGAWAPEPTGGTGWRVVSVSVDECAVP